MLVFIFNLLISIAWSATDFDLSEETDAGSLIFTQIVNVDTGFGGEKLTDPLWNWNLTYSHETSNTPVSGSSPITDNTNDILIGLGWMGESGWGINSGFEYTNTPEEGLLGRGSTLSAMYRWIYREPADDYNDEFLPSLTFKLNSGATNYIETYSGTIIRSGTVKPTSGTNEILQTLWGLEWEWRPLETWKYRFGVNQYIYNRNVAEFQSGLDSPAALRRGMSGFSNTVGGLSSQSFIVGINWLFAKKWTAVLYESFSIIAADSSNAIMSKATVEYQFANSWRVALGAEYQFSNIMDDSFGILKLGWHN